MTDFILGLDGGGTKTLLTLANRHGQVVYQRQMAGIGPIENSAWQETLACLLTAVSSAPGRIVFGVFGLPSYGEMPGIGNAQEEAVARLSFFPYDIINDVHAAFDGAFTGNPGTLLLAGTGSMVWAEDEAGTTIHVGGWGHGFGDEGSAFWIGHTAITAFSHCLDGRAEDAVFVEAMAFILALPATNRAAALSDWYYGKADARVKVAALARAIDSLANSGNATAKTILQQAADHLSRHVRAAWRLLPSLPTKGWSAVGSVMNSRHIIVHLEENLETSPLPPALPPVGGALWRAATNAGWQVDTAWIETLRAELCL